MSGDRWFEEEAVGVHACVLWDLLPKAQLCKFLLSQLRLLLAGRTELGTAGGEQWYLLCSCEFVQNRTLLMST
jgi:hypothetical protein